MSAVERAIKALPDDVLREVCTIYRAQVVAADPGPLRRYLWALSRQLLAELRLREADQLDELEELYEPAAHIIGERGDVIPPGWVADTPML